MEEVDLFTKLGEEGYTRFGVSGNGFVSQSTGLHEHFDELYYTSGQGPFLNALIIYEHVFGNSTRDEDFSAIEAGLDTLRAVFTHEHPLKSLANLSAVGLNRISANFGPMQRIPHSIFHPFQPYSYSPSRNTRAIRGFLSNSNRREEPFFVFANYMDTHRPYFPPDKIQTQFFDEPLPYGEITRLNDDIADPWNFVELENDGQISESDIEDIQSLYAGEVVSADQHLGYILEELEKQGLRDDTVVVITADHGENLGERDEMGRRRMGHHSSMSDALVRVPLLIAHPDIEGRDVEELVSLRSLYEIFTGGYKDLLDSGQQGTENLIPDDGIVICEYPATGGGDELRKKYPDAPEAVIDQRVQQDCVSGYFEDWRIVVDSVGGAWAWKDGESIDTDEVPAALVNKVETHLERLMEQNDSNRDLGDEEVDQLEALGYL